MDPSELSATLISKLTELNWANITAKGEGRAESEPDDETVRRARQLLSAMRESARENAPYLTQFVSEPASFRSGCQAPEKDHEEPEPSDQLPCYLDLVAELRRLRSSI